MIRKMLCKLGFHAWIPIGVRDQEHTVYMCYYCTKKLVDDE